jgi:hypothetical protein
MRNPEDCEIIQSWTTQLWWTQATSMASTTTSVTPTIPTVRSAIDDNIGPSDVLSPQQQQHAREAPLSSLMESLPSGPPLLSSQPRKRPMALSTSSSISTMESVTAGPVTKSRRQNQLNHQHQQGNVSTMVSLTSTQPLSSSGLLSQSGFPHPPELFAPLSTPTPSLSPMSPPPPSSVNISMVSSLPLSLPSLPLIGPSHAPAQPLSRPPTGSGTQMPQ